MDLLKAILAAQGNGTTRQLANQFGINESQTQDVMTKVLPLLARGLSKNSANSGGLGALLGALQAGQHSQYLDNPSSLGRPESTADGNKILGHIFGSKDVSRNVAAHAAQETGVDVGIIKKMLPLLAGTAMGALSKQSAAPQPRQGGGGLLGMVAGLAGGGARRQQRQSPFGSLLDMDGDGSHHDDILNLAKKFL